MACRLRQSDTNISEVYIGRPIYIPDVRYLYRTSDIYIGHPISTLDIQYLYPTSDTIPDTARARARARAGNVGFRYRTSDIDFGNIGGILS